MLMMLLDIIIKGVRSSTSFPLCNLKDNKCISYLNIMRALLLLLLFVMLIDVTPSHNVDIENCSLWHSYLLQTGGRTSLRHCMVCQPFMASANIIIYYSCCCCGSCLCYSCRCCYWWSTVLSQLSLTAFSENVCSVVTSNNMHLVE